MENNKYYRPDPLDKREYFSKDLDFTTNSPSYYEALSRFTSTLRLLTERLNDVEGRVIDLFLDWLRDGVIEEIINVNIFTDLNNRLISIRKDFDRHIIEEYKPLENLLYEHIEEYQEFYEKTLKDIEIINNELNSINKDIAEFKLKTNNNLKKLNESVPLNHYVSEQFSSLQEGINKAEGGTIYVKPGVHLIDKPIKIKSNTTIMAYGVTFRRNANIDNMFINDSDGTKGGFSANNNINIYGATFDGMGGTYQDKCTIVAFGHSNNIKIVDCTFKNLVDWHMIELNSVRNGLVENCIFKNYGNANTGTEMVQIDIARGTSQFPWFGPYDNTTCETIIIRNNKFSDGVRGVGTHSSSDGTEHHRIYIIENEFYNMSKEAVYGLDWAFTKIHSNHFRNVKKAVHLRTKGRNVHNHSINDNYMSGKSNDPDSRGIQISGVQDGTNIDGGSISNNKVKRFGSHGIGVDYCSKWELEGNEVTSCGKAGIIIYGTKHSTVGNNVSRGNDLLEQDNTDINVSSGCENIILTGNVAGDMRSTSTNAQVFATGNIIHKNIRISGTNSQAVNNLVTGTLE